VAVRYPLLHRTASATIEAQRFKVRSAVLIVHSFSQNDLWFEDLQTFVAMFGVTAATVGRLHLPIEIQGLKVFSGWARGEERFLQA